MSKPTAKGAATGEKRKRGRPKKPVYRYTPPPYVFSALPPGPPSKQDFAKLVSWHRNILESHHFLDLVDDSGDLTALTNALADAIEAGDAYRVGYYAKYAMRSLALKVWGAPILTVGEKARKVTELAEIGRDKLRSDKRRGHRGRWG